MASLPITQITDLHLGATPDAVVAGIRPFDSFLAVLDALDQAGHGDDLLLLTGDLSGESSPSAYSMLNGILRDRDKNVIWLPGNHDDLLLMEEYLIDYPLRSISEIGNWGILTLDSSQAGTPIGRISDEQLQKVSEGLSQLSGKSILVSMHHCPTTVGCQWLDKQRITNSQDLYDLLSPHSNVKAVITGHVHQQFDGLWGNIPLYTSPSSSFQFKPQSENFSISNQPPGYRWLTLESDGSVNTGVKFLSDFNQHPDTKNIGY
ncbi:metallophosphoesterase [Porticoccaceae bacterium nBUS_17]